MNRVPPVWRTEANGTGGRRRPADGVFLAVACTAALAIVITGFAPTYYLKLLSGAPPLPILLHVHGALMTAWFVLFFIQVCLIASHRVRLHRRLGMAGAVVAGLILTIGATVDIRAARLGHMPAQGPPPLQFMGFLLFALLVFGTLVSAALLLRRRPDYHKRLMLLSCFSLVGPGLFRIPPEWFPPAVGFLKTGGPAGLFGLDLLLVYLAIGWDTWRHRRLHPALVCGAVLIAAEDLPVIWGFLSTGAWTHFATWLVGAAT
jgi:hypothetical protein